MTQFSCSALESAGHLRPFYTNQNLVTIFMNLYESRNVFKSDDTITLNVTVKTSQNDAIKKLCVCRNCYSPNQSFNSFRIKS